MSNSNNKMNKKVQILGGKVVTPSGVIKADIVISAGRIIKIGKDVRIDPSAVILNAGGQYILPGFIDIHTNGIAGFDLTNGLYDPASGKFSISRSRYLSGIHNAMKAYAKHGTTLALLSSLEAPHHKMKKIFRLASEYKNNAESVFREIFYGIYMEGTFIKDKDYCGAHNPSYFHKPSVKLFKEYQDDAKGAIKIVNVAPEWGTDALRLINDLKARDIICAAGHTGATGDMMRAAAARGTSLAVHIMNGPLSSSYKPFDGGGALEVLIQSENIFAEIIPDGYHVDKSYIMDLLKRKGADKCAAITDSMFVTDLKGIKEFSLSGLKGRISRNKKYLVITGREPALFGSSLTMDKAFENLINLFTMPVKGVWYALHKPIGFEEALIKASALCSATPAKILGIYSSSKKNKDGGYSYGTGAVLTGKRADLALAKINRSKYGMKMKITDVLINGIPSSSVFKNGSSA